MAELTFLTTVNAAGDITACAEQTPVYAEELIEAQVAAEGNAQGLDHHWPVQRATRTIPVIDNCALGWADAIQDAIADWNAAQGWLAFVYQAGMPDVGGAVNDAVVIGTKPGMVPPGHNGITYPNFNAAGVYRASIYLRDETYFDRSANPAMLKVAASKLYDIVLHEVGHVFVLPDTRPDANRPAPYNAVIVGSQPMDTTCASSGCDDGTGPVGQWCRDRLEATYTYVDPVRNKKRRRKRRKKH